MSFNNRLKLGILGGGQLGRMLIQAGISYDLQVHVLDPDVNAPCKHLCQSFTQGNLLDEETVYQFGKNCDILTIEIEHVNVTALERLEAEGVNIIPRPATLKIIQDKGSQKQFYLDHQIPSPAFVLLENAGELTSHADFLPAFQKLRKFGYDGKGVQYLQSINHQHKAFHAPSLLEKYVDMEMEISVIVVKNQDGQSVSYPPVELVFDPKYNLVDYLLSPARISEELADRARAIAMKVADALDSPGIFAVEMFLTKEGEILVNETAPRAHNSGHQSMEGNYSSQFDQQIRALLNLPLGDTSVIQCSLMLNLIGAEGYSGAAIYEGLEDVLAMPAVYVHLYGKKETKPGRKMGHITLLGHDAESLIVKAKEIKSQITIKA